jgi:hypothetical protein
MDVEAATALHQQHRHEHLRLYQRLTDRVDAALGELEYEQRDVRKRDAAARAVNLSTADHNATSSSFTNMRRVSPFS